MQKNVLWIITGILLISVVGLIIVQSYWVRNAVNINKEQFTQIVNKGLDNIVDEIENREMVSHVVNEMEPFHDISPTGSPSINYTSSQHSQKTFQLSSSNIEKEIFEIKASDSLNISTQLQQLGNSFLQLGSNSQLQANERSKQSSYGKLKLSQGFSEKLNNRTVFVENVVNKLIQIDVELEDRIDEEVLGQIIKRTFNSLGINTRYEYSIKKNNASRIYQTSKFNERKAVEMFSRRLFPNDIFIKDNFLEIYFPQQNSFILRSTGWMASLSAFLMFIMILGCAISIHIMFKQKRLSQVKNDFVNNMTHELKTPISTISLASQMLKDDSIPIESKNIKHISGIIDDESRRLSYQVEKVLKTALFDQGELKLRKKELDVHGIIESVVRNFEIQVESRKGVLNKRLDAEDSFSFVDEIHFTNIIFNLLDNAVKYSHFAPRITISTKSNSEGIYVTVADRGIGIRKQDQKRIFDQFYRVSTGNRHDVKGFGLGLSYVKRIVDAHNGTIRLDSEYRRGTSFEIFIPNNNINDERT
ncbi:MAG: HAMP domain-containing histidine kinase [Bacteroidales bacterium]|nr:HAMP domain-containing histidine kinase [Bacteroidales bacterium]